MDWFPRFLYGNGFRHERVKSFWVQSFFVILKGINEFIAVTSGDNVIVFLRQFWEYVIILDFNYDLRNLKNYVHARVSVRTVYLKALEPTRIKHSSKVWDWKILGECFTELFFKTLSNIQDGALGVMPPFYMFWHWFQKGRADENSN